MKKWYVSGTVVAGKFLGEVEAETEKEAIEKGWELAHVSVCHQCAAEVQDPEIDDIAVTLQEQE